MSDFTPTKAWARQNLKAVEQLIREYRVGEEKGNCPLCCVNRSNDASACPICPWKIFKGADCHDLSYEDTPIPDRLPRLYGWRIRLKNFISGKTVWDKKTQKFRRAA